ncbi:hypothetical protein [Sinobaca sp. H24]|uniref:hypothetical protein n=1 Tax=Sinobaca sp. H24 TaxID=2923376 RepID=UPI002079B89D|nr:hypothetical protein [Sinobaca sp. H24]
MEQPKLWNISIEKNEEWHSVGNVHEANVADDKKEVIQLREEDAAALAGETGRIRLDRQRLSRPDRPEGIEELIVHDWKLQGTAVVVENTARDITHSFSSIEG